MVAKVNNIDTSGFVLTTEYNNGKTEFKKKFLMWLIWTQRQNVILGCRFECKQLIDKGVFNKGFTWNPSSCECECDKVCDTGEYLDYENCKCRKKIVDKLVEECIETVEEVKLAKITLAKNENSYKCSFCTVYFVLFWIFFTINVGGIGVNFIYFHST